MKLSDSEKRDIVNLIQKDLNLPEKYRFLLFDKVDQVELNWYGKSNEVTNIVLPFQIIEQIDEPRDENYQFDHQSLIDFESGRQLKGWTNKFIHPPHEFKIVDGLITNFHQPESTLLMLTSSFGGYKFIKDAYKVAKKKKYRFLSYGDSMLIT